MKLRLLGIIFILCLFLPGCSGENIRIISGGSASDIQNALDIMYQAGGGTVIVTEGEYVLNRSVIVRENCILLGAGVGKTTLLTGGYSRLIEMNEDNTRVTGISLVNSENDGSIGIRVNDSVDFRIDHCQIEGFSDVGIAVDGKDTRGVIDHCEIKMELQSGLGYGVLVLRDNYWEDALQLGTAQATFIEDCVFINARHAVAANGGAHYVFRYNTVREGTAHQVDAHGLGFGSLAGTRCIEIYNNVIEAPLNSENRAIGVRGGGGVIFDNIVSGYPYIVALQVESHQVGEPYPVPNQVHDLWIWNNHFDGSGPEVIVAYSPYSRELIQENRDFFLYPLAGYVPYPYPHPRTLENMGTTGTSS